MSEALQQPGLSDSEQLREVLRVNNERYRNDEIDAHEVTANVFEEATRFGERDVAILEAREAERVNAYREALESGGHDLEQTTSLKLRSIGRRALDLFLRGQAGNA
jgi:hypothetical protein